MDTESRCPECSGKLIDHKEKGCISAWVEQVRGEYGRTIWKCGSCSAVFRSWVSNPFCPYCGKLDCGVVK